MKSIKEFFNNELYKVFPLSLLGVKCISTKTKALSNTQMKKIKTFDKIAISKYPKMEKYKLHFYKNIVNI